MGCIRPVNTAAISPHITTKGCYSRLTTDWSQKTCKGVQAPKRDRGERDGNLQGLSRPRGPHEFGIVGGEGQMDGVTSSVKAKPGIRLGTAQSATTNEPAPLPP